MGRESGISVKFQRSLCESGAYGKSHRFKFGRGKSSQESGHLFSADMDGPFDIFFTQHSFVVIFKDDYTKFRCGYFSSKKSNKVPGVLPDVVADASPERNRKQQVTISQPNELFR